MSSDAAVPFLELRGAEVAQCAVQPRALVLHGCPLEDCGPRVRAGRICLVMGEFPLEGGEERFRHRVVVAVTRMAHALSDPVRRDKAAIGVGRVLHAAVASTTYVAPTVRRAANGSRVCPAQGWEIGSNRLCKPCRNCDCEHSLNPCHRHHKGS